MEKSPFDQLPTPDPKKFRRGIKINLRTALDSFVKFSDSIRAGKPPAWPPTTAYVLFSTQLNHFRSISKRAPNARPIQLIREMDKKWRGLGLVKALEGSLKALREYLEVSVRSRAVANCAFNHETDNHRRLVNLLSDTTSTALYDDLEIMLPFLPRAFQVLSDCASPKRIRAVSGGPSTAVEDLHASTARCAQLYLISERRAFLERCSMAYEMRKFFFELGYWPYREKLFGLLDDQIREWHAARARAGNRARQHRYREKTRQSALRSE